MANLQPSYASNISPPPPGTIAGQADSVTVGICETAAPGIPFGRAVSQGTLSDEGVILGGALVDFRGTAVRDITLRGDVAAANLDHYLPPNSVGVMEEGSIWLEPATAVTRHAPVFYATATGLYSMAAGGGIVGPIPGAYWKTSCGIGGRAIATFVGGRAVP